MKLLPKITALITHQRAGGEQLLLIQHPHAGIQIPAGTVEEGEALEQALLREVREETGLPDARISAYLGQRDELPPGASHVIYHTTPVFSRPRMDSFDWATLRRGLAVQALREAGGFVQITYQEGDQTPDPAYISYQITGWVPASTLAAANRRYFYHLRAVGAESLPDAWPVTADNHTWTVFWAALADLPEIVQPQREWVQYLYQQL